MLSEYGKIDTEKIKSVFNNLSAKEKQDILEYIEYRKSRGLNSPSKLVETKSTISHLRATAQKDLSKLSLKEIIKMSALIKESSYSQYSKNEILINFKRYLKYKNPNLNLEDIRLIQKPASKIIINQSDLLTKEDVEKLISHEPKMFWKAFLITQYEAGLRTQECRLLKWEDIVFNVDGDLTSIKIFATKTNKPREVFIQQATFYLKKLRDEQSNLEILSKYVFHSPRTLDKPIARANISMWMRRLSKKTLGKVKWNYLLRHSRGNELYQLSKQGKISKEIALAFMGHSEKMSKVYTHDKTEEIKQMLKNQIYHLEELPPQKKAEFEKQIDLLRKALNEQQILVNNQNAEIKKAIDTAQESIKLSKQFKELLAKK